MTGVDTPCRVNDQAGTLAAPRLVRTRMVVGLAAVTAMGVVTQLGHLPPVFFFIALKTCTALSTVTFMLVPSGHVTSPSGAPDGGGPVKTRSPLPKASLVSSDGKPPLGPELRSSASGTTRPVFQTLPSGEFGQALASWRARAWNAATFTPVGDGLGDWLVDSVGEAGCAAGGEAADAEWPTDTVGCPELATAHPATALTPRQAASRASRCLARTIRGLL